MDVFLVILMLAWLAGRAALQKEQRASSNPAVALVAPFGRIVTIPAGAEILIAKIRIFRPYTTAEPMRVWVGWWNCRSFVKDGERYYIVDRRDRFAIPVAGIGSHPR